MEFNILWNSIKRHEGEIFYTVRGLPFTYRCTQKQEIQPFRDGRATWKITRNNLEKAVNMMHKPKNDFNKVVIAPSYVYSILTDSRITNR